MDNVQLTQQNLQDLNDGEEIVITFRSNSNMDVLASSLPPVTDLKISPPISQGT